MCSVVRAELFYGSAKSQTPFASRQKQLRFLEPYRTLTFDDESAVIYGELRAILDLAGTPIGLHDLQIASIALQHQLTVVTHNIGEFQRVPNLKIENWEV